MPGTGLNHTRHGPRAAAAAAAPARPRGWARCRALLDAAAALFVEKGFAATSLTDVLRQAGGSRTTLYKHFGDKEGLFRAMMEEHCAQVVEGMARTPARPSGTGAEGAEERLTRFGLHLARTLYTPETMAILRTLISEGGRIPDLVEAFFHVGPEQTDEQLTRCFQDLAAAGHLRIDDPAVAARAFGGMVVGHLLLKRLILPDAPVAMDEVERYVRACVRMVLHGIGPAGH
ncbi:AcrR family transcriptional regulator [Azospirillum fermentarium]|uniref:TetR/AcrR family transcriptional regulator n=1 Tax=Azospirillum fermentarium TaxID=1233114 RepID=UPI0022263783|nr:TetR/AcrR family transcriptional regulator [Azospirillum fermentarium]MCW2248094.1 AcrR family transcriptional regulator [Azospirillum fermentarium]